MVVLAAGGFGISTDGACRHDHLRRRAGKWVGELGLGHVELHEHLAGSFRQRFHQRHDFQRESGNSNLAFRHGFHALHQHQLLVEWRFQRGTKITGLWLARCRWFPKPGTKCPLLFEHPDTNGQHLAAVYGSIVGSGCGEPGEFHRLRHSGFRTVRRSPLSIWTTFLWLPMSSLPARIHGFPSLSTQRQIESRSAR